jgi:hypothetical protein
LFIKTCKILPKAIQRSCLLANFAIWIFYLVFKSIRRKRKKKKSNTAQV